jgi:hypothetical protein
MKIRSVRAELLHAEGRAGREADRQTDITKLIIAFHNFANAPKMAECCVTLIRAVSLPTN